MVAVRAVAIGRLAAAIVSSVSTSKASLKPKFDKCLLAMLENV